MNVLVVDDNPVLLRMICDVLQCGTIGTIAAANSEQAEAVLQRMLPDAIVLDMQLPGKDGFTFARELKSDPRTRAIPIVAVTSYAMSGDGERALAAGCDGYVAKPIDTRSFASLIASYCGAAAASVRSLRSL
jgi:CheY-like chemotaxis protein